MPMGVGTLCSAPVFFCISVCEYRNGTPILASPNGTTHNTKQHTIMNNAITPQMNGIIADNASAARKAFLMATKAFGNLYGACTDDMKMLRNLESMLNTNYCEAVIADNFKGAQGVAAACRAAFYMLEPCSADYSAEFACLSRMTNFLEMSIGRELIDAQEAFNRSL